MRRVVVEDLPLEIRRMRAARGWTQAQLARRLGVSQQQVAKMEGPSANPSVTTMDRVGRAFGKRVVVVFEPGGGRAS